MTQTLKEWLEERAPTSRELDAFLDEDEPNWASFDPELGYVLTDSIQHDGLDGCGTVGRYAPTGERRMIQFAERPCRINTYGNSFTQGHQVSDGETWQEVLAAHLGEPIRNFGVGGYGVYQAWRRLLRTEETASAAENLALYIWGDDHERSLMPMRRLFIGPWFRRNPGHRMFHANPWAHLAPDPERGEFVERPNSHPTPESLYRLCDADHLVEAFGSDPIVQLEALAGGVSDVDRAKLQRLAEWMECDFARACDEDPRRAGRELFRRVALRGTIYVLAQFETFASERKKNPLVILGYPSTVIRDAIAGVERDDRVVLEFLEERGLRYVDIRQRHMDDARQFRSSAEEYVARYYLRWGHYSPIGNHFFAFAIKDEIVDWLDPKPATYRVAGPARSLDD